MTKRVVGAQVEVAAVRDVKEDGTFTYTLPNGKVIQDATEEDLFQTWVNDLKCLKSDLQEVIEQIDRCFIRDTKKYARVAARRGRVVIVRGEHLKPVDVYLQAKERRS